MSTIDWRLSARCRDEDPDCFFPLGAGPLARFQTEQAKEICGRCLVATRCLAWAIDNGEAEGIYGGRTPAERKKYGTGPLPIPRAKAQPEKKSTKSPTCPKRHPFDEINTWRRKNGARVCKACSIERQRRVRAARKVRKEMAQAVA